MEPALYAPLPQFGTLEAHGEDARAFLHGQLSNDIEHLTPDRARAAGYCSAKGRLLADFLVVPHAQGFLLQVSRDLAPVVARRLSMFVLRARVKLADASERWNAFGIWGAGARAALQGLGLPAPADVLQVDGDGQCRIVALAGGRFLVLGAAELGARLSAACTAGAAQDWTLAEVREGWPHITLATQDQFVPQMANLELIGGVDFKKGCYPGQEIVARTQYLGKLKRRMYRGEIESVAAPTAGQDLFSAEGGEPQAMGTVVSAAARPQGGFELLAVLQSSAVEQGTPIHVGAPDGPLLCIAPLPYALPPA